MLCLFDLLLYSATLLILDQQRKNWKKKRKILFGGNRPLPIFIFYDHVTTIAAEAHFIPNPGCLETLLPTVLFQEQYKGRKWLWKIPDKGVPHWSNRVTIFLENSKKFRGDFRDVWLVNSLITPRRFSTSSETCGWTPAGNNLQGLILQVKNC